MLIRELSPKVILCSVSAGRSSSMMAVLLKKIYGKTHKIVYVFANTSRERNESLDFMYKVDQHFNLGAVWIEAITHHGKRKSNTHKVIDYHTAKRDGSVYEDMIKKYGIPNKAFPHCTRELKTNPIKSYAKTVIGRYGKDYHTAIGYRHDERAKRIKEHKIEQEKHYYPLADWGITKADVALFWSQQPFDLEIADYQGNCRMCFKKSKRKILTQIEENPEDTFIDEMEAKYEQIKPKKKQHDKTPVRFFREGDSIKELREEAKLPFEKAVDKSRNTEGATFHFDADMDYEDENCGSSCEAF